MEHTAAIIHVNANGVRPRVDELKKLTKRAVAVSIQDTRLRDLDQTQWWKTHWPNFRAFFWPHDDDGPGCALLVQSSLRQEAIYRRSQDRQRLLSVLVTFPDGWRLMISSLYAAPAIVERGGGPLVVDLLRQGLAYPTSLLVGDLNARSEDLGCRSTNRNGEELAEFLDSSGTFVLGDPAVPTFAHSSLDFSDCIDWALATPAAAASLTSTVGPDVGSDHWPLVVQRPRSEFRPLAMDPDVIRWRTTKGDWRDAFADALAVELLERDLLPTTPLSTQQELEETTTALEAAFRAAADETLPRSRPRAGDVAAPPWWLRALIKERRRLRRQLAYRPSLALRQELNEVRRAISRAVEDIRRLRLEEKARAFARGPQRPEFWPAVRRWFRNQPPAAPTLLRPDGSEAITPADRAAEFARHLEDVLAVPQHPSFDAGRFITTERLVAEDHDLQPLTTTAEGGAEEVTRPVMVVEVARLLQSLRPGKAPGPDGISTDLLRAAPDLVADILAEMFTASLRLGFVPSRWKRAWVRLLPKPAKAHTAAGDFRPISLTSCLGKLLERLVARRLQTWCDAQGLLPREHSGFRFGRDSIEQVVLLQQRVTQAFNGGLCTAVAALDINKAYDSVWHAGLLHLCRDLLPLPVVRWVASFLRDRTAQVLEDGALSPAFATPGGVPQGSPLSPLLFVLFVRSLPLPRGPLLGASVYADDVTVWASAESPAAAGRILSPFLDGLVDWGRSWRLQFAPAKTQLAFFSRRQGGWTEEQLVAPVLCGVQLSWESSVDLLGIRLDRKLSLLQHARRAAQRLAPRLLELRRLSFSLRTVPRWVRVLLVKVLIRPCLTFAAPAWTPACTTAWERLEQLDRKAVRFALREPRDSDMWDLLDRAGLQPLRTVFRRLGASFLKRHVERSNLHLLAAFASDVRQRPDLLRQDEPLERLLAWTELQDRGTIVTFVRENVDPPPPPGRGRASRARFNPPERWGISPW